MDMPSKSMRCSYCSSQKMVPSYTHAIQCTLCENIIYDQHNGPLGKSHNSFRHRAAGRLRDKLDTAKTNVRVLLKGVSTNSGPQTTQLGNYPQQARLSASPFPVSAHGRKRAVLCGVSYYGQKYRLNGTVNDVKCVKYFLMERFGFPSDSILVLTEEESNPYLIPTKKNIRMALKWMVQGCQSGDSLVFHYSGHGSQLPNFNRDEVDGYDEILWPVDHQIEGTILDDEINDTIVRPLPRGAKLHAIIDACHSGTILDLPFVCKINRGGYYKWEDHRLPHAAYKGTDGGCAISITACDDNQSSGDTTAFTGSAIGALTYSFVKTVEQEPRLSYGRLLMSMQERIGAAREGLGLISNASHLSQEPQLSSSHMFDIHSKPFTL